MLAKRPTPSTATGQNSSKVHSRSLNLYSTLQQEGNQVSTTPPPTQPSSACRETKQQHARKHASTAPCEVGAGEREDRRQHDRDRRAADAPVVHLVERLQHRSGIVSCAILHVLHLQSRTQVDDVDSRGLTAHMEKFSCGDRQRTATEQAGG